MNRKTLAVLLAAALLAVAVLGWRAYQSRQVAPAAAAASGSATGAPAASGSTSAAAGSAAPTQLRLAPGDVVPARRQPLVRSLEISGTVKAADRTLLRAKAAGELLQMAVREGESVQKGQIVARIDATEADLRLRQAQRQADAARAQLDIARRQLDNNRALQQQGFISPTALEASIANDAAARANLQAAEAAVDLARRALDDAVVRAPMAGRVASRLAQPGERVAIGGPLMEIVDLSRMELAASVPPEDAARLRIGSIARLAIEGRAGELQARVQRINPVAAPGSRSVTAYLSLTGAADVQDGLFARGRIELERRDTLVLPLSAVRIEGARPYAVRIADGRAEHRTLSLGSRGLLPDGQEAVEVTAGLAEGDRVLQAATGAVAPGTLLTEAPAAPTAPTAPAAPAPAAAAASR